MPLNLTTLNPLAPTVLATTEITQLRIHPIKSCRGIMLHTAYMTRQGLDLDRNWMFAKKVEEPQKPEKPEEPRGFKYYFQTIRQIARLTLVDTAFATSTAPTANGEEEDLELLISIRGQAGKEVRIPARPGKGWLDAHCEYVENARIRKDTTNGWVYPDAINKVFSQFLGQELVLMYKGPTPRYTKGNASYEALGRKESVRFPDQLPLLIANEKSMAQLNGELTRNGHDEIGIERFRPNIVVKGGEAWEEDKWRWVRVVNGPEPSEMVHFGPRALDIDVVCRCGRYGIPNVEPETAKKHKSEPWDTMCAYRRIDAGLKGKPGFGMLSVSRDEGVISVGMKVEVLQVTEKHFYIRGGLPGVGG